MKKLFILSNLLLIIAVFTMHFFYLLDNRLYNNEHRKRVLQNAVEIPYSLIEAYEVQARNDSNLNREKLKEEFYSLISNIRYNQNNVIFVIDGEGNMIIHPFRPELTWWNILYETDSEGNYLFRELISLAKRDGDVFMRTNWSSKFSDDIYDGQYIYGKYFWPWNWIICSTSYDSEFISFNFLSQRNMIITLSIIFLINNILVYFLTRKKGGDRIL